MQMIAAIINQSIILFHALLFSNVIWDITKFIGSAILVTGLILFIVNNAYKTANYRRKAFYFLIVSSIFIIVFASAIIYDHVTYGNVMFSWEYYVFPLTASIASLFVMVYYFVRAKQHFHQFTKFQPKKVEKKEEYLYILYRYQDDYYLHQDKDKLSGDVVRFSKNIYFRDEMITSVIQNNHLQVTNLLFVGTVQVKNKQPFTFYCYEITLQAIPKIENLVAINKFDMMQINALEFHKNIILRMLIKEPFNISM